MNRENKKKTIRRLHYKEMVKDIFKEVDGDWTMEIEDKLYTKGIYTQEEALQMASAMTKVWMIAHSVETHCCGGKYLTNNFK